MLIAFLVVGNPCILEINNAWSCNIILLIHYWVLCASTVFRIFASIFIVKSVFFLNQVLVLSIFQLLRVNWVSFPFFFMAQTSLSTQYLFSDYVYCPMLIRVLDTNKLLTFTIVILKYLSALNFEGKSLKCLFSPLIQTAKIWAILLFFVFVLFFCLCLHEKFWSFSIKLKAFATGRNPWRGVLFIQCPSILYVVQLEM